MSVQVDGRMPYQLSYDTCYGIVDFESCDIVNASGGPIGQYGYREQTLTVGEIDKLKHRSELVVDYLDVDQGLLYPSSRLDDAKEDLAALRQKGDSEADYHIVKFTHKSYHYMTFEETDL